MDYSQNFKSSKKKPDTNNVKRIAEKINNKLGNEFENSPVRGGTFRRAW